MSYLSRPFSSPFARSLYNNTNRNFGSTGFGARPRVSFGPTTAGSGSNYNPFSPPTNSFTSNTDSEEQNARYILEQIAANNPAAGASIRSMLNPSTSLFGNGNNTSHSLFGNSFDNTNSLFGNGNSTSNSLFGNNTSSSIFGNSFNGLTHTTANWWNSGRPRDLMLQEWLPETVIDDMTSYCPGIQNMADKMGVQSRAVSAAFVISALTATTDPAHLENMRAAFVLDGQRGANEYVTLARAVHARKQSMNPMTDLITVHKHYLGIPHVPTAPATTTPSTPASTGVTGTTGGGTGAHSSIGTTTTTTTKKQKRKQKQKRGILSGLSASALAKVKAYTEEVRSKESSAQPSQSNKTWRGASVESDDSDDSDDWESDAETATTTTPLSHSVRTRLTKMPPSAMKGGREQQATVEEVLNPSDSDAAEPSQNPTEKCKTISFAAPSPTSTSDGPRTTTTEGQRAGYYDHSSSAGDSDEDPSRGWTDDEWDAIFSPYRERNVGSVITPSGRSSPVTDNDAPGDLNRRITEIYASKSERSAARRTAYSELSSTSDRTGDQWKDRPEIYRRLEQLRDQETHDDTELWELLRARRADEASTAHR